MSYTINGGNFSTWGMVVLESKGALDIPKRLGETEYDWGDSNGVEAYVSSADLFWDGRIVTLTAFYSGANLITDIETFVNAFKGEEITLVTSYGVHTCILAGAKVTHMLRPNTKALIDLSFWEEIITPGTPPTAIGGTGVTYGGYDFFKDFNLIVRGMQGYGDIPDFESRAFIYGDSPRKIGAYRKNRGIKIELTGKFASLATLVTKVNALKSVLMSAGLKNLVYQGVIKPSYFTEGAKVEVDIKTLIVRIQLNLKIQE